MRRKQWLTGATYVAVGAAAAMAAYVLAESLPRLASLAPGSILKVM
ncbi:MAG: hypothetical protein WCA12_08980 [Burkholderiales bacterium]